VRLVGALPREGVIERYASATAYVQPSRVAADGDRDGIPNVLLEAMAMAVPVIATRVSGIPEVVVDGHNGLLVEPDDAQAIADAVQRLIEQPALGAQLARAARRTVTSDFDNDHNLRLVLQLLEDVHAHPDTHAVA
jgi:glycosyltransferase involved in cell wall biosynthesis